MAGRMLAIVWTEILGPHFMRVAASVLVVSGTLAGCVSERVDVWADVKDMGPDIKTRHRYKLAGYKWKCPDEIRAYFQNPGLGDAKLNEWCKENERMIFMRYSTSFCRFQPNVFSDTGIPIVLNEVSSTQHSELFPTFVLSILSFFAFPAWIQGSGEDVVAINVGNADIDIGKVTVGMKSMESLSLIIPSSLVLCGEGADSRKDAGYSMSALMKNRIFFDRSETPEQDRVDGVMAYAIASRLKELEDSGQMDAILVQSNYRDENSLIPSAQAKNMPSDVPSQKSPYRIISFVREADSDFAYDFALEMDGDPSVETFFGIQGIFAREVLSAYKMEHPYVDVSTLKVDVLPRLSGGRIVGRAAVLTIVPLSQSYDANTRRGKLSVRFHTGQSVEARAWIRRNIETLVRDKNIATVTGQQPPAVTYYLLGEKIEDNVMEVEFKAE